MYGRGIVNERPRGSLCVHRIASVLYFWSERARVIGSATRASGVPRASESVFVRASGSVSRANDGPIARGIEIGRVIYVAPQIGIAYAPGIGHANGVDRANGCGIGANAHESGCGNGARVNEILKLLLDENLKIYKIVKKTNNI